MNRRFWLGIITGATMALAAHAALIAGVTAILRRADMAEPRTWTAIDEWELDELLHDLNGQQP